MVLIDGSVGYVPSASPIKLFHRTERKNYLMQLLIIYSHTYNEYSCNTNKSSILSSSKTKLRSIVVISAMFTRLFYRTSRVSFLPSSPDFEKLSSQMARHLKNGRKKFFRRDINAEEPWTRATLGGNVLTGRSTFFSPLVCRAQKYRDPLDEICSF